MLCQCKVGVVVVISWSWLVLHDIESIGCEGRRMLLYNITQSEALLMGQVGRAALELQCVSVTLNHAQNYLVYCVSTTPHSN